MTVLTRDAIYEVSEGIATIDKRGFKWEYLSVEGNKEVPIGKETQNQIEEEDLENILRKEGMIE